MTCSSHHHLYSFVAKIWISDKECFYKKTFETFHSNFNIFAQPLTHVHSLIRICMTQTKNFV